MKGSDPLPLRSSASELNKNQKIPQSTRPILSLAGIRSHSAQTDPLAPLPSPAAFRRTPGANSLHISAPGSRNDPTNSMHITRSSYSNISHRRHAVVGRCVPIH
jgi:hypothetical protein